MAQFTDTNGRPVEIETSEKTRYYDAGRWREIETPYDSGKYVCVTETMTQIGAVCTPTPPTAVPKKAGKDLG